MIDDPFNECEPHIADIGFAIRTALGVVSVVSDLRPYWGDVTSRDLAVRAGAWQWADAMARVLQGGEGIAALWDRAEAYLWSERTVDHAAHTMRMALMELVTGEPGSPEETTVRWPESGGEAG